MSHPGLISKNQLEDLSRQLGNQLQIEASMVLPFVDFTDMLTGLLEHVGQDADSLVAVGHVTAEVEMAADRAGLTVREQLGPSPFIGRAEDAAPAIRTGQEIVYLANPNRATGADYALKDLETIARSVKDGTLIVDEKYFDFYGISALPLMKKNANVVIVRSLTAGFGIRSDESGFLVGSRGLIGGFKGVFQWTGISTTLYKIIVTTLANEDARRRRLSTVHQESFRLTTQLTRQGVQNRITAGDFMLLRVADPTRVGNFLARHGTPIENLAGYPGLENYVRYVIQSPLSNDRLLTAFAKMPAEYYRMNNIDKRAVMFRRPTESREKPEAVATGNRLAGPNTKEVAMVEIEKI